MKRRDFFATITAVVLASAAQSASVDAPISSATIDFSVGIGNAGFFAFDNLSTDTVSLTMDEVPFQPVDGLTVGRVTFGFSGGSADYNEFGPGTTSFVDDPSIEGDASGVLSLDLGGTTNTLSFGISLSDPLGSGVGAVVELFDVAGASLGAFDFLVDVDPDAMVPFVGGQFKATVIPVPASLPLVLTGLASVALAARCRPRKAATEL